MDQHSGLIGFVFQLYIYGLASPFLGPPIEDFPGKEG
jgi:hypothetical protein